MPEIKHLLIKPFGPSIFKAEMPDELVNNLNLYVDKIINDKEKISKLDHGNKLTGDVTQEFKLETDFIKSSGWGEFLMKCTDRWIQMELKKRITKFSIIHSWIVRQFENEYNPTHTHGGHISGAGFLKVPSSLGNYKQSKEKMDFHGGKLQLIHGSQMFLSRSLVEITPKVGDFYFFPNYLMHAVFPFKNSNEERRSISFNAKIDDNIYDVYGNYGN